jgi:hypothetical protein
MQINEEHLGIPIVLPFLLLSFFLSSKAYEDRAKEPTELTILYVLII